MKHETIRSFGLASLIFCLIFGPTCRDDGGGAGGESFYIQNAEPGNGESVLSMDFSSIAVPSGPAELEPLFHLPPVRQDETGTCWAFAATSLLESELNRMGRPAVKLSEMHTAYWEYVEKARRFIRERGDSFLGQGSEPNSALERIKQYGIVRAEDYTGLLPGATAHDHGPLFREFRDFLRAVEAAGDWDEERGVSGVRAILDRHIGRPPETIVLEGRTLTPQEYLAELGLRPDDYVSFLSFQHLPFHSRGEYRVPDNWWRCADYHNLRLDEFDAALREALDGGFSAVLAVDFSEPGYSGKNDAAVVPVFDIPGDRIDQSSREFRFSNGTSTDDHAVHCVGWKRLESGDWFLIKDSWKNAYVGKQPGYFFYRGDYIRLKCLMFLTHRDAVRALLDKFPRQ